MKYLLFSIAFLFACSVTAQETVTYDVVQYNGGKYQISKTRLFPTGSRRIEFSDLTDSAGVVAMAASMSLSAKLKTKDLLKMLIESSGQDLEFNEGNRLIQTLTGQDFYIWNNIANSEKVFTNEPEVDTIHSKYNNGKRYTAWTVTYGGNSVSCVSDELGNFVQSDANLNPVDAAKRGRLRLYEKDFGSFIGAGQFPLVPFGIDVVRVSVIETSEGRKELWMNADRTLKLLKNL